MPFCITHETAYGTYGVFIDKKSNCFTLSDPIIRNKGTRITGVTLLATSASNELDTNDFIARKVGGALHYGTGQDALDAVQSVYWTELVADDLDPDVPASFFLATEDEGVRIDRIPANKKIHRSPWELKDIDFIPEEEKAAMGNPDFVAWMLKGFAEGREPSLQDLGEHAVELLKNGGLDDYYVAWCGRLGGEEEKVMPR